MFELIRGASIPRVPAVTTARDIISRKNPGESRRCEIGGKNLYDLIEQLRGLGLYKAETR